MNIIAASWVALTYLFSSSSVNALLKDGDIYRLTSVSDGNVLTVGGKAGLSGSNVTAEPWQDGGNQKWLAVESAPSTSTFILIPKWQSWNWNDFAKDSTKLKHDHLPDFTLVLGVNAKTGMLSNQGFSGKNPQQWKTAEGKDNKDNAVVVNSQEDNKCMTNPGEELKHKKKSGIASKIAGIFKKGKKKTIPGVIHMAICDPSNTQQLWIIDTVV